MYSYSFDTETGGILLNSSPTKISKEPRPVYAKELDILGFDKIWKYTKKNDKPLMWAEATSYFYFGKNVAKIKDGNLYTKPEIIILEDTEPKGKKLKFTDISKMNEKNRELLSVIEQTTVKKIFDVYKKYEKKLDCFSVAFSGGKDSIVLLELVKRALPHNVFYVIFGDTQMEFPDTYSVVNIIENQCKKEHIVFLRAKNNLNIIDSWKIFGPPSRTLRWCCSVHKSAPQTIALRNHLDKNDYRGLSFVGVRAEESPSRSAYDELSFGEKIKGQYSHNAILEWTSAEIWSYIFANNLVINDAYKKGNTRAGCLLCPMGGGNSDFFRYSSYPKEIQEFVDIIKEKDNRNLGENYIITNGWGARNNGRDLQGNKLHYFEKIENGFLKIDVINPKSNYKEWLKTIGNMSNNLKIEHNSSGYSVYLPEQDAKENPSYVKLLKQVFRKSAYCINCKTCEANCRNGSISFDKELFISNCLHCGECHKIDNGCLRWHSLRFSINGDTKMKINSFAGHTAKPEWFRDFFNKKENFFKENSLGPNQLSGFKRFLRDAEIIEKESLTRTGEIICNIGWDTETALGIMLANLAYNPQFEWFIKNLSIGKVYEKKHIEETLLGLGIDKKSVGMILESFKRICETAFGTNLNFGNVTKNGEIQRTKCNITDNRVVMYSLYKFAEKANNYYQFTLTRLLNFTIDSNGISPNQVFGIAREEMQTILLNLTAKYPEFINASFTHDLDKVSLTDSLKSSDVLDLFK